MVDKLTENDRFHLRLARELRPLVQTEGWKLYTKLLLEHKKTKEIEALTPSKTMDDALMQNAAKGAYLAFALCLDLPGNIVKIADEIVARRGGQDSEE